MTVKYDSLIKVYRKERLKEIESGPRNKDKENYNNEFNKLAIENKSHDLMYIDGIPHNHPSRMNISNWKERIIKPEIEGLLLKEQEENIGTLLNFYYILFGCQIAFLMFLFMLGRA